MPTDDAFVLFCRIPGTKIDDEELWGAGAFSVAAFLEDAIGVREISKGGDGLRRFASDPNYINRVALMINLPPVLTVLQKTCVPYYVKIFCAPFSKESDCGMSAYWAPGMERCLVHVDATKGNQLLALATALGGAVEKEDPSVIAGKLVAGYNRMRDSVRQLELNDLLGG